MCQRILVVDDDRELRSLLQGVLESEGYAVDTACDGQNALEQLEHQPGAYAVILLDMNMPRMSGLHLIRALRQQEAALASRLLAVSANREALHQAVELGVLQVLEKPFDLEALLNLVSTCVA